MEKINEIVNRLNEKWYKTDTGYNKDEFVEVFVNPYKADFFNMDNMIKFVADGRTKSVYVWDSDSTLFHDKFMTEEGIKPQNAFLGYAEYKRGKLYYIGHDGRSDYSGVLSGDYDWMGKHIFKLSSLKAGIQSNMVS